MAKTHTDEHGNRYRRHADVLEEELKDPGFREAYIERRRIHEIARAVYSMRKGAGLTQGQLAKLVNMKQPAIARLETSQYSTPQFKTLHKIGMALHKQLTLAMGDVEPDAQMVKIRSAKRSTAAPHASR